MQQQQQPNTYVIWATPMTVGQYDSWARRLGAQNQGAFTSGLIEDQVVAWKPIGGNIIRYSVARGSVEQLEAGYKYPHVFKIFKAEKTQDEWRRIEESLRSHKITTQNNGGFKKIKIGG